MMTLLALLAACGDAPTDAPEAKPAAPVAEPAPPEPAAPKPAAAPALEWSTIYALGPEREILWGRWSGGAPDEAALAEKGVVTDTSWCVLPARGAGFPTEARYTLAKGDGEFDGDEHQARTTFTFEPDPEDPPIAARPGACPELWTRALPAPSPSAAEAKASVKAWAETQQAPPETELVALAAWDGAAWEGRAVWIYVDPEWSPEQGTCLRLDGGAAKPVEGAQGGCKDRLVGARDLDGDGVTDRATHDGYCQASVISGATGDQRSVAWACSM